MGYGRAEEAVTKGLHAVKKMSRFRRDLMKLDEERATSSTSEAGRLDRFRKAITSFDESPGRSKIDIAVSRRPRCKISV
jgi:hypothetical protein